MSAFPPHSTTPTRASPALARNLRPRRRPRRVSTWPAPPAAPSPRRARLRRAWVDKGSKGSDVSESAAATPTAAEGSMTSCVHAGARAPQRAGGGLAAGGTRGGRQGGPRGVS
jgi:hypothetical protein